MKAVLLLVLAAVPVAALLSEDPLPSSVTNVAEHAGLTATTVFGGKEHNRYLLETTGCGAAFSVDLGKRRLGEGNVEDAVARLREAVRLAPDLAEAHFQLALALERQGAPAEARRHFEEARRLAPYLRTQTAGRSSAAPPIPQP